MSTEELLNQYQGHIVPQRYNAGFVALSYVVSFVGAASTLELISRRTGFRGFFNHLLLVGSAITMGGISIWCMHFIGNRAIDLANGEAELQISYSAGFTAISFFVPVIVLLGAFITSSTNNIRWWHIAISGILCGTAICGMHYLGNESIRNYRCIYKPAFVVGAAIIAVMASTIALSMFFVFRALWADSWWKRMVSTVILAGAVSGMHWCAVVGTRYRLLTISSNRNEPPRNATVIVVICLSLGACFIIAGSVILRARNMKKRALRAQQVLLAAATFDKRGRILVDADGVVPNTVVTDTFVEKNNNEGFNTSHPLFQWMFFASRNWLGISSLVPGMKQHILQQPQSDDRRGGVQLVNEHGEMTEGYQLIFREQFCLAAATLSEQLKEPVTSRGVLWDEILPTGASVERGRGKQREPGARLDMAEKGALGQAGYGRGSLMFLVRRVETDRDVDRLISSGFRFAEPHQVSGLIRRGMQIQSPTFETTLESMAAFASDQQHSRLAVGIHLGFFAIRARPHSRGFEVLVLKTVRNRLPSVDLSLKQLENWQAEFLVTFRGWQVKDLVLRLFDDDIVPRAAPAEARQFAHRLGRSIKALREIIADPLFEDALFSPTIVRLPGDANVLMITLQLVVPVHGVLSSPSCDLVPLTVFKMHQVSPQLHQAFTRSVHHEFGPIVKSALGHERGSTSEDADRLRLGSTFWPWRRSRRLPSIGATTSMKTTKTHRASTDSSSTVNLYSPGSSRRSRSADTNFDPSGDMNIETVPSKASQTEASSYSGILIFREVTVNVEDVTNETSLDGPQKTASATTIELQPMGRSAAKVQVDLQSTDHAMRDGISNFVDVLFAETVERR